MAEKRYRQFMYVQDLEHLKVKASDLKKILEKSGAEEWAFIFHDADKKEASTLDGEDVGTNDTDGTTSVITSTDEVTIRKHLHVVLKFENARTISSVAKLFNDKPQYVEVWRGKIENAYSYLLHRTSGAKNKHQYDPKDVIANFDFEARIKQIQAKVKASKQNVNNSMLAYANGEISLSQLTEKIGPLEVAKRKKTIDNLSEILEKKYFEEWVKKFDGEMCKVIWIWGPAGVGKTRFAKKSFENSNLKFTVLGSSKDIFQPYSCTAEDGAGKNIILDDLRPNALPYDDLLRILDPYQHRKMGPARYHDRYLTLEKIIITTPYSPNEFYKATKGLDYKIDTFDQLQRRIFKVKNLGK